MRNDLLSDRRKAIPCRNPYLSFRMVLASCAALIALYLLGSWVYEHFFKGEEDKIRDAIFATARAARDRRPSGVTEILSQDFVGPGGIKKDHCHQLAMKVLITQFRELEVKIRPSPIPVIWQGEGQTEARVEVQVEILGKATPESPWVKLPFPGEAFLQTTFKRTDKGWKVSSIKLVPAPSNVAS